MTAGFAARRVTGAASSPVAARESCKHRGRMLSPRCSLGIRSSVFSVLTRTLISDQTDRTEVGSDRRVGGYILRSLIVNDCCFRASKAPAVYV